MAIFECFYFWLGFWNGALSDSFWSEMIRIHWINYNILLDIILEFVISTIYNSKKTSEWILNYYALWLMIIETNMYNMILINFHFFTFNQKTERHTSILFLYCIFHFSLIHHYLHFFITIILFCFHCDFQLYSLLINIY